MHVSPHLLLILSLALLAASPIPASSAGASGRWTVYFAPTTKQYSVRPIQDKIGVATALYADERSTNGWTRFNIETNTVYQDLVQATGAGYLEGYVTRDIIWQFWMNMLTNRWNGRTPALILAFMNQNIGWMEEQIARNARTDPYWLHVSLINAQLKGILAGYNAAQTDKAKILSLVDMHLLQAGGDLGTIQNKLNVSAAEHHLEGSHCSSLIKVTPDLSELYTGHTTWSNYYTMLRVYKLYNFAFAASQTNARTTLFSGYPARLSSIDDFYQLSTKLVVMETTNDVWNRELYVSVTPFSLLSWVRVLVANRMATGGKNWVDIFSRYNSGTYNNQWMVVDYSLFTPHQPLKDNLIWIAEQLPGYIQSADVTSYIRNGFWPSYNIPFFQHVYNISGYPAVIKRFGDYLTYDLSPRAQIFRRDANNATTLDEYLAFLRSNNWQNDPLSDGNPANQISARRDLVPTGPPPPNPFITRAAFGGIDSKATSSLLVKMGVSLAQSGPSHDSLPPFDWSIGGWKAAHVGLPTKYNFGWVFMPSGDPKK